MSPPPRNNSDEPIITIKLIDFYIEAHSRISNFPKREQYTLGKRIEDLILEIISLAVLARAKNGRSELLIVEKIDVHLKEIMILLRISEKIKSLKTAGYTVLSKKLIELGKIIGGWIKNMKAKND